MNALFLNYCATISKWMIGDIFCSFLNFTMDFTRDFSKVLYQVPDAYTRPDSFLNFSQEKTWSISWFFFFAFLPFCTLTTTHGKARSLAHWPMLGIKPASSWFLVRFVSSVPWWELLFSYLDEIWIPLPFGKFSFFFPLGATPAAYGGSQARGLI